MGGADGSAMGPTTTYPTDRCWTSIDVARMNVWLAVQPLEGHFGPTSHWAFVVRNPCNRTHPAATSLVCKIACALFGSLSSCAAAVEIFAPFPRRESPAPRRHARHGAMGVCQRDSDRFVFVTVGASVGYQTAQVHGFSKRRTPPSAHRCR